MSVREWSFTLWAHDTPMVKHARAAVRNGFAVVFLRPGGKEPLCPLTARERKKAGPTHPCGVAHASRDERWVVRVGKRLEDEYGHINLGIAAHASGVVVIDADGPEQSETVAELLRQLGSDAAVLAEMPTVQTPGKQRGTEWVHQRGTHWYFNRPDELDLPQYPGQLVLPGGAVMRWGNSYTLVPPSERAEGPYVSLAEYIPDVHVGLVAMIRAHVETKTQRMADLGERFANDAIVRWSLANPWHTLLEPDGWHFTGKLDHQCGCPVWRRPGDDASTDRSAIAHEDDCTRLPNLEGHGALYVFSDNPPGLLAERVAAGQRTFTKLQYVTWARYDGDETVAKIALGLELDPDLLNEWLRDSAGSTGSPRGEEGASEPADPSTRDDGTGSGTDAGSGPASAGSGPASAGSDPPKTGPEAEFERLVSRHYNNMAAFAEAKRRFQRDNNKARAGSAHLWVPPSVDDFIADYFATGSELEPSLLRRTDGKALLYPTRVSGIAGRRSAGKTWSAIQLTKEALEAEGTVLYYDMEDNRSAWKARLKLIGCDLDRYVRAGQVRWVKPGDLPDDTDEMVTAAGAFDVVVFDVMNRLITRRGGNPDSGNEEIGWLYDNVFDPLCALDTCVYVLDHPNRRGQRRDATIDDMGPGGGAMKLNHASGHVMAMRVINPFSRERITKPMADARPEIQLITIKDREGHFEEGAIAGVMRGEMDIVDNHLGMTITITPPGPDPDEAEELATLIARLKIRILTKLGAVHKVAPGKGMKVGALEAALSKTQREYFAVTLELLCDDGEVTKDDDDVYRLANP
jgi:hypothetical protein